LLEDWLRSYLPGTSEYRRRRDRKTAEDKLRISYFEATAYLKHLEAADQLLYQLSSELRRYGEFPGSSRIYENIRRSKDKLRTKLNRVKARHSELETAVRLQKEKRGEAMSRSDLSKAAEDWVRDRYAIAKTPNLAKAWEKVNPRDCD
jgi:predicted nuclease with TOPRIM domain